MSVERLRDEKYTTYLGDGVYAVKMDYGFVLCTFDGITVSNEIYFEPEVLKNTADWINSVLKKVE